MKYIVVLIDGMADHPLKELGGKTPLAYARTPNMDKMAARGLVGMVKTIPDGFMPGSDVANLSVLGYDPAQYYTGRAPLEAASIGVELGEMDVAFRCNLVTLSEEEEYSKKRMIDYSSDEISTEEARELIEEVDKAFGGEGIHFYAGTSYRHLMVWEEGPSLLQLTPPHDISDRVIGEYLPKGEGADRLLGLMVASSRLLPSHPINLKRREEGLRPSTSIWIWGHGRRPRLKTFYEKYGLEGGVISAVDLVKGIGIYAGLDIIEVNGATGTINTNFEGKAEGALEALREGKDFVYIHIEAADEAGHRGEIETKIRAIEEVDEKVIGTILSALDNDYRLMVLPDHATPISTRTHSSEEVPFVVVNSEDLQGTCKTWEGIISGFHEESARRSRFILHKGHELMDLFLGKNLP